MTNVSIISKASSVTIGLCGTETGSFSLTPMKTGDAVDVKQTGNVGEFASSQFRVP